MLNNLFHEFITLWAVIDPIGTIPIFLAVAAGRNREEMRKLALVAVGIAAAVLLFFIIAGQLMLESMSIPLTAFQIAGGIVLFLFALTMIFGDSKPEDEMKIVERGISSAAFPLAIPSIASPGAMMAVVLLTDNHNYTLIEQGITTAVVLAVLSVTLICLLLANRIYSLIGEMGASIVSRVMGLILAAVATNSVLSGISLYFDLTPTP